MRTPLSATLLALTLLATPTTASAQDFGDVAAYIALNFTPLGGLVPLPPPATGAGRSAFVLRYGNLDLGEEDAGSLHNFSIGADFATGRGRLGLTLGGTTCDGCDGNIMAGLDYTVPLTQNVVSVALRPAFGFSKPLDGDGTALSLGLSLPLGVEFSGATGPVFIPYIVPGFGFGRISGEADSESGTRAMLGGGFALAGREAPFAVHAGFQRVFIDDGEMTFGLGVSIGRRTP
jgi:hypothetical protein